MFGFFHLYWVLVMPHHFPAFYIYLEAMLRYLQVLVWVSVGDWVSTIALQLLEKGIISPAELCVASCMPFFQRSELYI